MFSDRFSKVASWTLISAGGLAVLFAVIRFAVPWPDAEATVMLEVTLTIIGLLCVGLGAERLGPIEKLLEASKRERGFIRLDSGDDVYREAARLVREVPDASNIKATDLFPNAAHHGSRDFEDYMHALQQRLEAASARSRSVNYRLVVADTDVGNEGLEKRRAAIDRGRPQTHVNARAIKGTFPLEVLIVDSSVLIAFPEAREGNPLMLGVLLSDVRLAHRVGQWYDDFLWSRAQEIR